MRKRLFWWFTHRNSVITKKKTKITVYLGTKILFLYDFFKILYLYSRINKKILVKTTALPFSMNYLKIILVSILFVFVVNLIFTKTCFLHL